ncbi:hypothetical protein HN371_15820 [Candidatus Poribacteria bacterium]|nr:hypothetical protein [Candidatus Poribacteria bacterium]MBT5711769.1 hypothetical protein [Candidatus Poribacteria bacterium]MBT7098467.1 hypothetical protein [Candidatus Poribacteria bacterium]MBT7808914.1 hypothetical protein [Candidatus Poribacteria bacterium]
MSSKGSVCRDERRHERDARTGAETVRLTSADAIHHTLYFTHASMLADDDAVVFVSNRACGWNLFRAAIADGRITQVTDTGDINPFSVVIDPSGARVFYTAAAQVRAVDLVTGAEDVLADFGNATLGGCDVTPDGSHVLTVMRGIGDDTLVTVATDGSATDEFFAAPRNVGYAQFCPGDPHWVLYSSGIEQRMWTVSRRGVKDRPLYLHDSRRWITHESFLGAGDEVIFTRWPDALMAIRRNGDGLRTVAPMNAWHASSTRDGSMIVADTTLPDRGLQLIDPAGGRHASLCFPGATSRGTRWGERTPEAGAIDEATYGPQWTHPHPAFSPSGRWVTYTSDRDGSPHVYAVRVPEEPSWRPYDAQTPTP